MPARLKAQGHPGVRPQGIVGRSAHSPKTAASGAAFFVAVLGVKSRMYGPAPYTPTQAKSRLEWATGLPNFWLNSIDPHLIVHG